MKAAEAAEAARVARVKAAEAAEAARVKAAKRVEAVHTAGAIARAKTRITAHKGGPYHPHPAYGIVKNYLSEHYGISDRELIGKVTPGDFPYLSFDNNQNVTLFDDPSIHAQFNVKEHYAAVTDPLGHLHTFYKAYEVVPKFADTISKVTTNVKTVKP